MILRLGVLAALPLAVCGQLQVPKTWDVVPLADWATPIAALGVRPGHFSVEEYYRPEACSTRFRMLTLGAGTAVMPGASGCEKIDNPFTVANRHPQPAARSLRSRLSQWPIAQITDSEPRPQGAGRPERKPLADARGSTTTSEP